MRHVLDTLGSCNSGTTLFFEIGAGVAELWWGGMESVNGYMGLWDLGCFRPRPLLRVGYAGYNTAGRGCFRGKHTLAGEGLVPQLRLVKVGCLLATI